MDRPTQPEGHPLASDPYFTLMADAEGVGYVHGGDGMRVVRVGGLGSLASLCGMDQLKQVLDGEVPFQQFLDLCERFDREIMLDGPGTRQRAGLIAVGERAG